MGRKRKQKGSGKKETDGAESPEAAAKPPQPDPAEPTPGPAKTPESGPAGRKRAFRVVTALGATAFAVLLLLGYYVNKAYDYYDAHPSNYEGRFIQEDAEIGYCQVPRTTHRHTAVPRYTVYTDDRSARVAGPNLSAPRSVDILAVGGSFTWGHGIEHEQTFVAQTAKRLGLRAYNVALASYGTTASLLSVRKYADLKPKVVIYGFISDHVNRSIIPAAPCVSPFLRPVAFADLDATGRPFVHAPLGMDEEYFDYMEDIVTSHGFGVRDVYWAIRRDFMSISKTDKRGLLAKYYQRLRDPRARQAITSYLIREMARECRRLGAQLVVVYLPMMPPNLRAVPAELTNALSQVGEEGVHLVDMTPAFVTVLRQQGPKALSFENDDHPNHAANSLVADQLVPLIQKIVGP